LNLFYANLKKKHKRKKIENIGNIISWRRILSISNKKEELVVSVFKRGKIVQRLIKMTILPFLNALNRMEKDSFS
jgi:hypothetical protein